MTWKWNHWGGTGILIFAFHKNLVSEKCEKSVGTTELHYSTKNREHSLSILKAFLVRHSSEYETSRQSMKRLDALYRGHIDWPPFPKDTFREMMLIATRGVEFSFNNQMYKQLDGVAMGSPLGPALANIFVSFHERRLFNGL